MSPWCGPLVADVTWPPAAVAAGLPGTVDWTGTSDMVIAIPVAQVYAPPPDQLRIAKQAIRQRLYTHAQRRLRDLVLAEIAARVAALD